MNHALDALEKGHDIVLVRQGVKVPMYRNWPDIRHTKAEIDRHIRRLQGNWGIKLWGLLVVDKDGSSKAAYAY